MILLGSGRSRCQVPSCVTGSKADSHLLDCRVGSNAQSSMTSRRELLVMTTRSFAPRKMGSPFTFEQGMPAK